MVPCSVAPWSPAQNSHLPDKHYHHRQLLGGAQRPFQHVRRPSKRLTWYPLLRLLCVAFIPFPTSVIGEHVGEPVAQQFHLAALLLTVLVMAALRWYMTSGRRLVEPVLIPQLVRRAHIIS